VRERLFFCGVWVIGGGRLIGSLASGRCLACYCSIILVPSTRLLFFFTLLSAQAISGLVQDTSGEPLPFVTVQNLRTQQGTYTDLQGRFIIQALPTDTLEVRALGYEIRRLPASYATRVQLSPKPIEVAPVIIRASDNPAYPLIRGLQAHRTRWNPLNISHAYKSYNKLLVTLPDSLRPKDSDSLPTYLTIWETETYKIYLDAAHTQEKILRQRISGNLPVQSFFSPTVLQPLGLYESWITILDKRFASPIGPQAFSYYDYELLDTLYQGADTLYHIRFFPLSAKQSWGMSGHFYVAVPDYALASVQGQVHFTWAEATTASIEAFSIEQVYTKLGDTLWFPTQLHTEVLLHARPSQRSLRLLVKTRSYLRDIEIPPGIRPGKGDRLLLPTQVPPLSDSQRVEALSPVELRSYQILDSLIAQTNLRRLRILFDTPSLISGRVPMGAFNLVLRPFLLYHVGEGWRPQLGIETSDKVLSWVRLRVWGGYGTKRQAGLAGTPWRYGAEIEAGQTALLRLSFHDDVVERTLPRLLDERPMFLPLTQSPYERFARAYDLGWESLVRQRQLLASARLFLLGRLWLLSEGGLVERLAPDHEPVRRYLLKAGLEVSPKETFLERGSLRWRVEAAYPQLRLGGGWLMPMTGWDPDSWFWQADLFHQWRWGRWAHLSLRLSGGQVGPTVPLLWHHYLRTLSHSALLSQPFTLSAHPEKRWGRHFGYTFLSWEIPNSRFPKPRLWTPTIAILAQGAFLDGRSYPEVGLRLKNWLPQTLARYARALSRLSPTLYKNARAPLSRGWFLRIEADL
jgi:hypothetical protein